MTLSVMNKMKRMRKTIKGTEEQIHYDLDLWYIADTEFEKSIIEVAKRLPEDVYDFIQKIYFTKGEGQAIQVEYAKNYKGIVIIDNVFSLQEIAHEIAHLFLGHGLDEPEKEESEKQEKEANKLIMKWGFRPANEHF